MYDTHKGYRLEVRDCGTEGVSPGQRWYAELSNYDLNEYTEDTKTEIEHCRGATRAEVVGKLIELVRLHIQELQKIEKELMMPLDEFEPVVSLPPEDPKPHPSHQWKENKPQTRCVRCGAHKHLGSGFRPCHLGDKMENLTKLGSEKTEYQFSSPSREMLETFPNPSVYDYLIDHNTGEFSSLCPKTRQPDYAHVFLRYRPAKLCVETKSLKLYLFAFRNEGAFMEAICNRIADDLIVLLQPKWLLLRMEFGARGGIQTIVQREFDNPVAMLQK